ncbi:MAG: hypothetical protein KGY60_04265 [Bacteroidales bacterium]|nr:hypothetical protein [Bacteroidales bacterium]
MKISQSQFKKLSEGEKAAKTLNNGKQISRRGIKNYYINLYSLGDFMVEIWYNTARNQIERVEIIDDTSIIDKYIDAEMNRRKTH